MSCVGNVLAKDGRISAVLDWGDVCAGDPATDLAAFWLLLADPKEREAGLSHYLSARDEPGLYCRSKAWAVVFGVLLLHAGLDGDRDHGEWGEAVLRRV